MKRWWLAMVLAAMPAMAQQAQDPNERVQKLVTLKYADPDSLRNLLGVFAIDTRGDSRMRVLTLSGPRRQVEAAEEAIKNLDVPGAARKDIELTVYFVVGDDQAPLSPMPGTIPTELADTVTTLKTAFPFKQYYLLDALSLRARSGSSADTTGQLSGDRYTTFKVGAANVEGDGTTIRMDRLHAGLRIPHKSEGKTSYIDTGITTDTVSVKAGQKLVVGRSSLHGPSKALFLVLIAKIAN
jgi:hypothetical protein